MDGDAIFRWIVLGALVPSLAISGYFRRKARRTDPIARSSERGGLVALRLVVTLPMLVGIIAYIVNPAWMVWSQVALPSALRWVGAAVALFNVPFVFWVLSSIGSNISETVLVKESHRLVTDGPYHWVRHPLYTSGLCLLTGIALIAANAFLAGFVVVVAVLIRGVVIPTEETALVERFGDAYRDYRGRTGSLFPRV